LIVTNKVKPAILGGLTVEFGDKTIDLSVASKVAKLNKLISGMYMIPLFIMLDKSW
jgi:F-type H+-transporting ATPase subunit O